MKCKYRSSTITYRKVINDYRHDTQVEKAEDNKTGVVNGASASASDGGSAGAAVDVAKHLQVLPNAEVGMSNSKASQEASAKSVASSYSSKIDFLTGKRRLATALPPSILSYVSVVRLVVVVLSIIFISIWKCCNRDRRGYLVSPFC